MRRIRVAPGKFVTISTALAEKAARIFASDLTRDQVQQIKQSEPECGVGPMAGSRKPVGPVRPRPKATPTTLRRKSR